MANPGEGNVDTGGLSNKGNTPNPQKPSGTSVIHTDKDEDEGEKFDPQKFTQEVSKKFKELYKANQEFDAADKNIGMYSNLSFQDIVEIYAVYLPENGKKR